MRSKRETTIGTPENCVAISTIGLEESKGSVTPACRQSRTDNKHFEENIGLIVFYNF